MNEETDIGEIDEVKYFETPTGPSPVKIEGHRISGYFSSFLHVAGQRDEFGMLPYRFMDEVQNQKGRYDDFMLGDMADRPVGILQCVDRSLENGLATVADVAVGSDRYGEWFSGSVV